MAHAARRRRQGGRVLTAGRVGRAGWARLGVAAAGLLVAVYLVAVCTDAGQRLDDVTLERAGTLVPAPVRAALPVLGRDLLPVAVALLVLALALLARRRRADLARAAVVVGVSVPLARGLREVLPRPDLGHLDINTLPSTHVALVAAGTVAALLLWPGARPSWVPAAALAVLAVGCAGNVSGDAHRPSDVVASLLLVAAVTGGVMAAAVPAGRLTADSRHPPRGGPSGPPDRRTRP